ncbi:MAG TPA: hypothetical protein PLZ57_02985 [Pseudobdellovibrionaceae bacterium]|nr:hypothetical protein [Pseudobdellovibrionaceae bacterium]
MIGAVLLIWCLMIRWPTGELDPHREAEAWVTLEDVQAAEEAQGAKDADSRPSARWEKMAENRVRLLVSANGLTQISGSVSSSSAPKSASTSAQVHSKEVAQATLTWSDRVTFASNDQGELLIGRGSQIWSRGPTHWRSWLVRDGWELEAAKWVLGHDGGSWELQWRQTSGGESPQGSVKTMVERRDRSLRKLPIEGEI